MTGTSHPSAPTGRWTNECIMAIRMSMPASAVDRVMIEKTQGLRILNCRARWASGEPSIESCRDPKAIMSGADFAPDVGVAGLEEACERAGEERFLTALVFLDRGVAAWLPGRRSTLGAGATICDRNESGGSSVALAPWPLSVDPRETRGSSASSGTERTDEQLCI
jgi:hypothetical protein